MKAYETILVPLDGSELAESVLPEVEKLASKLEAKVTILMVAYAKTTLAEGRIEDESRVIYEAKEYF